MSLCFFGGDYKGRKGCLPLGAIKDLFLSQLQAKKENSLSLPIKSAKKPKKFEHFFFNIDAIFNLISSTLIFQRLFLMLLYSEKHLK